MTTSEVVDSKFIQKSGVCVMASYGLIINYFSDNELSVEDLFTLYCRHFELRFNSRARNALERKHGVIYEQFHSYCNRRSMRGFNFVADIHDRDLLGTHKYCHLEIQKAEKEVLSNKIIVEVKNTLESVESLAMVLYKVSRSRQQEINHAVVVGFDDEKNKYYYRDPEKGQIIYKDFFRIQAAREILVFRDDS